MHSSDCEDYDAFGEVIFLGDFRYLDLKLISKNLKIWIWLHAFFKATPVFLKMVKKIGEGRKMV